MVLTQVRSLISSAFIREIGARPMQSLHINYLQLLAATLAVQINVLSGKRGNTLTSG